MSFVARKALGRGRIIAPPSDQILNNNPMLTIRNLVVAVAFATLAFQAAAQSTPVPPALAAKSWFLLETSNGQVLTSEKADERLEPASLTKLMTAYLTFTALHKKTISIDQSLPVSEKAWKTEGSKTFVKVNTQVPVEDLIKGMIVQSGNDACVVLAEGIAGSEENFAQMMNKEAQRLGLKATSFRNSTGLPDPQHYTTARDLATLASSLIRDFPEEYKKYYSMKEFRYNNITQPNRNRLLWSDPTVDGVKTGHTDAAGYCLISSATRNQRRLLSVVLGTQSDSARTTESSKLLNWGYLSYDLVPVFIKDKVVLAPRVWKGERSEVKLGFQADKSISVAKGMADKLKTEFVAQPRLIAPIKAGQTVGTAKLLLDGKPVTEYPLTALEDVKEAGFFGRMIDTVKLWMN